MLGKFMNLFFEEEEVVIEGENPEKSVSENIKTTPLTEVTVETKEKEEVKKSSYITIDESFSHSEVTETIKVNQSSFIHNDTKSSAIKPVSGRSVEYEFTPVLSPIFGVVGSEKRKIMVHPNFRKTEVIQPKESILGAGIRPYSGIVEERENSVSIPFDIKNGNKREEDSKIEKIDVSDIIRSETRMSRHLPEQNVNKEEEFSFFSDDEYQSFEESVQNHLRSMMVPLELDQEEVIEPLPYVPPIKTKIEPLKYEKPIENLNASDVQDKFDESVVVVKEKPSFFQRDVEDLVDSMERFHEIDEHDTFEEEDINLFNMEF